MLLHTHGSSSRQRLLGRFSHVWKHDRFHVYKHDKFHVVQPDGWYRQLCRRICMVQQRGVHRWLAGNLQVRPPSPHRLDGVLMDYGRPSRNYTVSLDSAVAIYGLHNTGRRTIRPEVCLGRRRLFVLF